MNLVTNILCILQSPVKGQDVVPSSKLPLQFSKFIFIRGQRKFHIISVSIVQPSVQTSLLPGGSVTAGSTSEHPKPIFSGLLVQKSHGQFVMGPATLPFDILCFFFFFLVHSFIYFFFFVYFFYILFFLILFYF